MSEAQRESMKVLKKLKKQKLEKRYGKPNASARPKAFPRWDERQAEGMRAWRANQHEKGKRSQRP